VQVAQPPPQFAVAASRRSAYRALCNEPTATVPTAPAMHTATHTPTSGSAVSRGAAKAAAPPAASITAAANCGGASARVVTRAVSGATDRDNDHKPRTAVTTAAHTQSTPAMSMGPQYEAARFAVAPGC
jgi:hypothetical protein